MSWKTRTGTKAEKKKKSAHVIRLMLNSKLAVAFRSWVEHVHEIKTAKKALWWWIHRLLRASFQRWREYNIERIRKEEIVSFSVSHWENRYLARAFYKWCDYKEERLSKRDLLESTIVHWEDNTLAKVSCV